MRACMIAYSFYEGDNRVMRYAETLAARGDQVDVLALGHRRNEPDCSLNGVDVIHVQQRVKDEKSPLTYLFRLLGFLFRTTFVLWRRHRRQPYDLVHVHSVPDFLVFAALPLKLAGVPVILDIHDVLPELYASKFGLGHDSFLFRLLLLEERISIRLSDHVIIANDLWRERLIHRSVTPEKCTTIMNYPDRGIFTRQTQPPRDGRFRILYPGSLNYHQGLDIAVRAMQRIQKQAPQAELHIYGEGPEKDRLPLLAQEFGVSARVHVHDQLPLREVARIMESADLAVIPKRNDGFGGEAFSTKTLEFMALEVPIVVAATVIDRHSFRDGQVRFFTPGDDTDLAKAVLELIEYPAQRAELVKKGTEYVNANDWTRKKHLYLDMVSLLTSRAGGKSHSMAEATHL